MTLPQWRGGGLVSNIIVIISGRKIFFKLIQLFDCHWGSFVVMNRFRAVSLKVFRGVRKMDRCGRAGLQMQFQSKGEF